MISLNWMAIKSSDIIQSGWFKLINRKWEGACPELITSEDNVLDT